MALTTGVYCVSDEFYDFLLAFSWHYTGSEDYFGKYDHFDNINSANS